MIEIAVAHRLARQMGKIDRAGPGRPGRIAAGHGKRNTNFATHTH